MFRVYGLGYSYRGFRVTRAKSLVGLVSFVVGLYVFSGLGGVLACRGFVFSFRAHRSYGGLGLTGVLPFRADLKLRGLRV